MTTIIASKIQAFFDKYPTIVHDRGSIITMAGQDPAGVSFLVEGSVEQYDITPDGNKFTVNVFKPLAFFPMSWAINKIPNDYFYGALTDVKLKQVSPEEAVQFLKANPDVLYDLLSRVYKGTDALLHRMVLMARGIASSRLVFELLVEGYRFGERLDDDKILVHIKLHTLAARGGLARETVSRELHKLETAGLIIRSKQGIIIDAKALAATLDFEF